MAVLRAALDRLYLAAGALAGVSLVAIGVLVMLSIVTRLLGIYIAGLTDYAGYAMASASFLALDYTFGQCRHLRVALILQRLHGRVRPMGALWSLTIGTFLDGY